MDRKSLAQELRRWVVEEMGLPQQKAPSEEMLQRLFIGQCADIWKYIIRHVRSQRTVKNIEGNLLWYRQLQHCEALRSIEVEEYHRRKHLCQEIQEVRSELQQIHEQIQCAEKEISSRDLNNQKSHDYRLRALMLRAFQRKRAQEWDSLQDTSLRLKHRCDKLRDITRASQCQIVFPDLEPTPAKIPEPVVLRDTRQAYDLRYTFLRTLYEDAVCGITQSINSPNYLAISHQQWISMSEKLWWAHPPFHIFSSLQHITIESTQELQQQQSLLTIDKPDVTINYDARADGTDDNREERKHGRYFRTCFDRPDLNSDEFELPTISSLFKDGWSQSVAVMSKIHSLDSQSKDASAHLAKRIKAIHQSLADGSESSALKRAAFDAELRLVMLRGQRDALLQECRDLEQEAEDLKEDVNFLENEQKDIEDTCSILNKKQHQIQILINNNAVSESRIRYSASEMQKYVLEKLSPMPQEIVQESQRLQDAIMKDVRHFCNVYLPALQKVSTGGNRLIPAQELSINRLSNPHFPYYPVYKKIYASVGLSLYKAPETLLPHVAEMKKQLLFLNSQLRSRTRAIARIMEQLHESQNPDIDALLQRLSSHYKEQTEELVPKLQRLIEQCQKSQEYGKEVQATVTDWWEQPAQLCLPWEERGGQTLRQWRDRWTVAVTALQRASGGKS